VDKKQRKKLKRSAKKKKEKSIASEAQAKVKKQMGMFDKLPSTCSACEKSFPKTKEAHSTWRVVVRHDKQQVRLFCPDCQQKAKELRENNNEV
jgi:Zn finger protein HypA/HybF involved in hydrogenase expression